MISRDDNYGSAALGVGERSDCAVRALSVAACISYADAEMHCTNAGRRPRDGMHMRDLETATEAAIGFKVTRSEAYAGKRPTLARFVNDRCRTGHWILLVTGHFVAIVDGVLHDWQSNCTRDRRHVRAAFRLI